MILPQTPDIIPPPQPPTTIDAASLASYVPELYRWLNEFSIAILAHEQNTDLVVNGFVEYPLPYNPEPLQTGNLRFAYVQLAYDHPPLPTSTFFPAIEIGHNFADDEAPKGWEVLQVQSAGFTTQLLVLDQIVSSLFPDALAVGYPGADVTTAFSITGNPAPGGGWTGNDIRAEDELKLIATLVGASTGTNPAGSGIVTRGAGTWTSEVRPGWWFRYPGSPEDNWRQIVEVDPGNAMNLVVRPAYLGANAALPYELRAWDQAWRRITAITFGGLAGDILTLDPEGPGTEIPVGTLNGQYVIRRPPNIETAWVRIFAEEPGPYVMTLKFF